MRLVVVALLVGGLAPATQARPMRKRTVTADYVGSGGVFAATSYDTVFAGGCDDYTPGCVKVKTVWGDRHLTVEVEDRTGRDIAVNIYGEDQDWASEDCAYPDSVTFQVPEGNYFWIGLVTGVCNSAEPSLPTEGRVTVTIYGVPSPK